MNKLVLASGFLLAGCVGSQQLYTQDGRQGYSVHCDGGAFHWGDCYAEASKICGRAGYEVLEKNDSTGYREELIKVDKYTQKTDETTYKREMLIACKR